MLILTELCFGGRAACRIGVRKGWPHRLSSKAAGPARSACYIQGEMLMTEATRAERIVLLAILTVSVGLFWWRLRKVLDTIRRSRATPDFQMFPIGPRIRQFVWEVLAQAKVIRQRPLAGIAHAFVFWGFCAFALVTLNHLATAFGWGFLDSATIFGRFYFGFAGLWAVAVAVSIAGLFVRR